MGPTSATDSRTTTEVNDPIPKGNTVEIGQVTAFCYLGFADQQGTKEAMTRMPQGQCTLPADDAGRVLDRLAGLEQVIRPEDIQQALHGHWPDQFAKLSADSRGHSVGGAGDGVVDRFADPTGLQTRPAAAQGEESPHRSSLCVARQRLGVAPVRHLFTQVVRPLARPGTPGAFYHDLRLMGIDGTIFDVPDSAANAAVFARPSAGPRGEGAFPQVRKLSLVELGTHVEVALVVDPRPMASKRWSPACSAI